jgi:hypothetical protein
MNLFSLVFIIKLDSITASSNFLGVNLIIKIKYYLNFKLAIVIITAIIVKRISVIHHL